MLISILENVSVIIQIQKGTKLNELFCKLLSISLFPLQVMVIEVQNFILY